ncbi:N2 [Perilla frutescens var. hirtella]|uniref:tRNA (guanine(26)-N(2))-dimethyltransferase n=1 Tax=Perilla frutescens var. hirtella TaxID=608512 RepID=A0AAD4P6J6_PERFH|nr:N2 [Perilla frutescens var. hirtella]KAH6805524.1 N2 [Perilla frutescens var. frutescens]KAH6827637.1 N2 [Perilla frutescens var. hirtella]
MSNGSYPAMLSLPLKPPISLNFKTLNPSKIKCCKSQIETERGHSFDTGDTFFRHESSTGRDLAVLSAAVHKKTHNSLRVLDAMCGCGIRSLRYLAEANADFVLANDANQDYGELISGNLEKAGVGKERWAVKHLEANRLLTERYLERDYFDLIDVDSFGSDSSFLRSAMCAVKLDGLMYVTCTDGYSSGGHRPQHTLAAYGAYVKPMPYSNEIGLRMLIGGALREASVLGYHVVPLFSCYSYHGPVFRAMLQLKRGKFPIKRHYGFISYCVQCGNSQSISWDKLSQMRCSCNNVPGSLVVSGPLWTGPLHNTSFLTEMLNLAEDWGWLGNETGKRMENLLNIMIGESDPKLPFGYIKVDEVSSRGKINSPRLNSLLHALHKEGYAASRSHIASNAIKTNCPMVDCVRLAKELQLCSVTDDEKLNRFIEA